MTDDDRRGQTIGDLRLVALALRGILDRCDAIRMRHNADPSHFQPGSPAERDAGATDREQIDYLLSVVNMRMVSSFDNSDALVRLAESACRGEQTPAYACWSIARSVLDTCGITYWLTERGVEATQRVGRALTIARYEMKSQEAIGLGPFTDELKSVDEEAARLGLAKVGQDFAVGYGVPLPSNAKLVTALTGDKAIHSLLSAATHGETWAIMAFGYRETGVTAQGDHVFEKRPPASGMCYALIEVLAVISQCLLAEAVYRGWEVDEVRAAIDEAYRSAGLRDFEFPDTPADDPASL